MIAAFAALPVLAAAWVQVQPASPFWAPSSQDTAGPGFQIQGHAPIPQLAMFATVQGASVVVFDGDRIRLLDLAQGTQTNLATMPASVYPSFVLVEPDLSHAVCAESSNGDLWRVDLASGALATVANLQFNFAAVVEDPAHLLVSAATHGFFYPNEIVRVEIATGLQTLVASVPGASGPLARAANGDLYYALLAVLFPPPDSVRIVRWTKAQVESGALLTEADATTFADGFDGVAALAFDPVTQHLLVAESRFPGPSEIHEYAQDGLRVGTVLASANWLANLELVAEPGPGSFQAFQPQGVALRYLSTDFMSSAPSGLITVRAKRPTIEAAPGGPSGTMLLFEGAYPSASLFVATVTIADLISPEATIPGPGFLLHTAIPLAAYHRGGFWLPTDGLGRASTPFAGASGTQVVQALVFDPTNHAVGTTTHVVP